MFRTNYFESKLLNLGVIDIMLTTKIKWVCFIQCSETVLSKISATQLQYNSTSLM